MLYKTIVRPEVITKKDRAPLLIKCMHTASVHQCSNSGIRLSSFVIDIYDHKADVLHYLVSRWHSPCSDHGSAWENVAALPTALIPS